MTGVAEPRVSALEGILTASTTERMTTWLNYITG